MNAQTIIPEQKRVHYPGTNLGNALTDVAYESWDTTWKLDLDDKKALYMENRVGVGGRSDGSVPGENDDGDDVVSEGEFPKAPTFNAPVIGGGRGSGHRPRTQVEPTFWFQFPVCYFVEMLKGYFAKQVIDLTPGAGRCALAAMQCNMCYVGICFNESHRVHLMAHITDEVKNRMREEGHPLYDYGYARWCATPRAPVALQMPPPKPLAQPAPPPSPTPPGPTTPTVTLLSLLKHDDDSDAATKE